MPKHNGICDYTYMTTHDINDGAIWTTQSIRIVIKSTFWHSEYIDD
jgi:hypothetical protein